MVPFVATSFSVWLGLSSTCRRSWNVVKTYASWRRISRLGVVRCSSLQVSGCLMNTRGPETCGSFVSLSSEPAVSWITAPLVPMPSERPSGLENPETVAAPCGARVLGVEHLTRFQMPATEKRSWPFAKRMGGTPAALLPFRECHYPLSIADSRLLAC